MLWRPSFWSLLSLLGCCSSLAVLVIAAMLPPDARGFGTHEQLGMAPCASLITTGKPCLSCGMTTSFSAMMHARPVQALDANPAGVVFFLLTLAAPFWFGHALLKGVDPLRFLGWKGGRIVLVLASASAVAVWLWRTLR
ncbi:MAG: DUF2752 domain-containing protein [Planctomycetes bacterium]|nr:DUF2752 domain-containing protein [Planctomycetota bacterium]